MKKTLLITAAEEMLFRNLFSTVFWDELLEQLPDWDVVLVVPPKLESYAVALYASDRVRVRVYVKGVAPRWADVVATLARRGIHNGTNVWSNWRSYERGDSAWLSTVIKHILMLLLGGVHWYHRLLRALILRIPSDAGMKDIFDSEKPTAFFATSLTNFDVDVLLAVEARRRRIPIVGMTRSWDNLSSHGLFRVVPDVLYLQNQFLKDMALRYQSLTEHHPEMAIIGLPHYDAYTDASLREDRATFMKRNHLDPTKKLIVYCGMGEMLFPKEADIIEILEEAIASGNVDDTSQVLYSAHPKFLSSRDTVATMQHVVLSDEVKYIDRTVRNRTDEGRVHVSKLINLLAHADVVVMGASTLAIDAIALETPVVCIGFDGKGGGVQYWHSVKRFYDSYTHFEALMETGAIELARNKDELISLINTFLQHKHIDASARERLMNRFVAPYTGNQAREFAGRVAADVQKRTSSQRI